MKQIKITDEKERARLVTITLSGYIIEKLADLAQFHGNNKSAAIKNMIANEWEKMSKENENK